VDLAGGTYDNIIGGLNVGQRNVMAGNGRDGIEISHDGTHDNEVVGNFIGLNATGTATTANREKGVTFEDLVFNNRIYRNIIAGNGGFGVRFYTSDDNEVYDNFIGVRPPGIGWNVVVPPPSSVPLGNLISAPNGTLPALGAGQNGIYLLGGSQNNVIRNNVIANHPQHGIVVGVEKGYLPQGTCQTFFNTFSRNSIFNNAQSGIRLVTGTCDGQTVTANQGVPAPTITSANTNQVTGTACANCTVEVFLADKTQLNLPSGDNAGEGKQFLGSGTANAGGNFVVNISGATAGQIVTATSTNPSGSTSQFAANAGVAAGAPTEYRQLLPLVVR
jgi:parallel beta-helix repeat protein